MTASSTRAEPRFGVSTGVALGCGVRLVTTRAKAVAAAWRAVDSVLDAIDVACSRFRADSELAALNARLGRAVTVSPLLAQALELSLRAARVTDGAVDPTVGSAVKAAGYELDFAAVPAEGGPLSLVWRPVPGWRTVLFDPSSRRVSIPEGVEIDLGATAKALAADLAATSALQAAGGGGVLVSLGGDIAVRGVPPTGGWRVQVSEDSGEPILDDAEAVAISNGGLATSSTTVRRWRRGGIELHHIINPRSGLPADGPWRTVTVAAGTCSDANIAATAAIVLGERALDWLQAVGLPARLVDSSGRVRRLDWPEP